MTVKRELLRKKTGTTIQPFAIQLVQLDKHLVKHHFHDATKHVGWECVGRDGVTAVPRALAAEDRPVEDEEHSPLYQRLN